MDKRVTDRLHEIRNSYSELHKHPEMLADLFLEEGIRVYVKDMSYETFPDPKVTLTIQVYL